jgi:demethylmenaquinone methyltransferase/2-methoxy-6-polyprenyl-1,4-benzoquinol methylase
VGISFAFRNLTYKNPKTKLYLAEILRVLKPGGKFVIVESSQPRSAIIRALFHLYLRAFVYPVGYLLSGNKGAYRYLAESAARFYGPHELGQLLVGAGFGAVRYRRLFFGAAAVRVAAKP